MNSKVRSVQIGLFVASLNLKDKLSLAKDVSNSVNNLFDGEPLLMPIPEDAPLEIPRVILRSKSLEYNLNISPQRIDLIFNNKLNTVTSYGNLTKDLLSLVEKITSTLSKSYSLVLNRLGLVVSFGVVKQKPVSEVLVYFDKSKFKIENDKSEVQIHLLSKENLNGYKINNWIRIIAQEHNEKLDKTIISNDLNIRREDVKNLNFEDVSKFLMSSFNQVVVNLKPYV